MTPQKIEGLLSESLTFEAAINALCELEQLDESQIRELVDGADGLFDGNGASVVSMLHKSAASICLKRLVANGMFPIKYGGGWILAPTHAQIMKRKKPNYVDPKHCKVHQTVSKLLVSVDWELTK